MKLIKYQIMTEVNHGTEDRPDIVQTFHACEIRCSGENFETILATAQAEAWNGEVTVEEIPMTAEEARTLRDKLLAESDWTQVLDAPVDTETREGCRVYRQSLRDIPEQEGFPETIEWPETPSVVKADPDLLEEGA